MTIEEIISVDTDAITIFKCSGGWQVSIRRPGTNAYSIGIDRNVTKAAEIAMQSLPRAVVDDDDWKDLI